MEPTIPLQIQPQPNETTCGPTCLHAVYRHYGEELALHDVISQVESLETGGTLGVLLGTHARQRGFDTVLHSYNLEVFDPSWFELEPAAIRAKLAEQIIVKTGDRLRRASTAYMAYLEIGGRLAFEDLTRSLIRSYLRRNVPILTGLSATYLYRTPREVDDPMAYDDLRGKPQGHFVVLCGYSSRSRSVLVADPLQPNPISEAPRYAVPIDRLVCAILLGVLTYDANMLVVRPRRSSRRKGT